MAGLNRKQLEDDIFNLSKKMRKMKKIDDRAYAREMSLLFEKFVKSGKLNVFAGQTVQVGGSGSGATTGSGTGIIE